MRTSLIQLQSVSRPDLVWHAMTSASSGPKVNPRSDDHAEATDGAAAAVAEDAAERASAPLYQHAGLAPQSAAARGRERTSSRPPP